jgi:glycosyltransferase involved in cell wall biosynthesis
MAQAVGTRPANDGGAGPGAVRRPHIVHIVGTPGTGGVQNLIFDLAASPAGRAYRHSLLCLFGALEDIAARFREAGLTVDSCSVPWPGSLDVGSYRASRWIRHRLAFTFPYRLSRALRQLGPDLVHTHVSHRIDLQAEGVLRRTNLPFVWTIHGKYRPEGVELERWRKVTRLAAGRPSAITAVAEDLARDFRERGLDHPDGILVTRGGVDFARFHERGPADPGWRARWGIPPEALVVGSAGRLVPEKAYEVFIRAAALIPAENRVHFVIAGAGPLERSLAREITRAGLEKRFHLIGFVRDIPRFLAQLDIFVLSSRFEGFPIALLEALASGLPTITTPVGGVPEMLGPDGGLIVAPESENELAAALTKMLDPATRAAFAARGPAIARRFSMELCAEEFVRLYARMLERAQTSKESSS